MEKIQLTGVSTILLSSICKKQFFSLLLKAVAILPSYIYDGSIGMTF